MSLINLLVQVIFWRRKVTFMSKYLWSLYSYSTPAELQLCLPVFRWCSRADSAPLWSELTVLGRWCSYEAQDLCILNRTHHKTHTYSPVPVERSQQILCDNIHKKGKNWLVSKNVWIDCTGTEVYLRLSVFSSETGWLANAISVCITWVTWVTILNTHACKMTLQHFRLKLSNG